MNRSYDGLYVCPMMWRDITNISSGAVCMVLASDCYDEFVKIARRNESISGGF